MDHYLKRDLFKGIDLFKRVKKEEGEGEDEESKCRGCNELKAQIAEPCERCEALKAKLEAIFQISGNSAD